MNKEREKFFNDCELVAKAPGSFFWAGEHAVVYGHLAILQPIPLYVWVGLEFEDSNSFEFDVRIISEYTNIPKSLEIRLNPKKVRGQWINKDDVEKILTGWKEESNFKQFFKVKIWSEVPSRCGLNSSGAISAALAALMYKLEYNIEYKDLMEHLKIWHSKKIFELKEDQVFLDIFVKAWAIDDCFHGFSSSGMGPFSSMVGLSEIGKLLLYFTESKGVNSRHQIKRTAVDYASAINKLKQIEFWAERINLGEDIQKEMQISIIYSGTPKATGLVVKKREDWFRIPVKSFKELFYSVMQDQKFQDVSLAKPIRDFLREYGIEPTDSEHFPKTIFMQSLGLLSWSMLKAIMEGNVKEILFTVNCICKFHLFYNIFSGSLIKCKEYIAKEITSTSIGNPEDKCAVKLTGAGERGDLVLFTMWNEAIRFEKLIAEKAEKGEVNYHLHYSTTKMGWKAQGLELTDTVVKKSKMSIICTFDDCEFEDELEIGIEGTPYVKVNGEEIRHPQPAVFANLLFFAASWRKRKNVGWVTESELKMEWSHNLSELREFLMNGNYKENVKKLDIIPRATNKKTRLQVFKKITLQHSICNYRPQMEYIRKAAEAYKKIRRRQEEKGKRLDPKEIGKILHYDFFISPNPNSVHRNIESRKRQTNLVSKALKMLDWTFYDKKWEKTWHDLIEKAEKLDAIVGAYSEDDLLT